MSTRTVSVSEFKATCLRLLDDVRRTGEPILITRRGKPLAQVVAPPRPPSDTSWMGTMSDRIRFTGDVVEPVSDPGEWEALGE